MIIEKQNKICKLIDFLLSIKIGEDSLVTPSQTESLTNIRNHIKYIQEENILDMILKNIVNIMDRISIRIKNLNRELNTEERIFTEKLEKYNETKEIANLFEGI